MGIRQISFTVQDITVAELIEFLKEYPQTAKVYCMKGNTLKSLFTVGFEEETEDPSQSSICFTC